MARAIKNIIWIIVAVLFVSVMLDISSVAGYIMQVCCLGLLAFLAADCPTLPNKRNNNFKD